jgi:hypothetical protein
LTQRLYGEAVKGFNQTYEELAAIGVDEQLTRVAGELASEYGLRQ